MHATGAAQAHLKVWKILSSERGAQLLRSEILSTGCTFRRLRAGVCKPRSDSPLEPYDTLSAQSASPRLRAPVASAHWIDH
jgi:hypothetical protein